MSLGPKLSEAPYTETDIRLLQAIASQMGLAVENSRLVTSLAAEAAAREIANRELEIAREVQERLFPQNLSGDSGSGLRGILPSGARRRRRLLRFPAARRRAAGHRDRRCIGQRDRGGVADGEPAGVAARPGGGRRCTTFRH